jgi:hypothetical protein
VRIWAGWVAFDISIEERRAIAERTFDFSCAVQLALAAGLRFGFFYGTFEGLW